MAEKSKKRPGRPKKNSKSTVPWETVDRLLVHGEKREDEHGISTRFPSYRELADRFQVSHSSISRYSQQHNCLQRRQQTTKKVLQMSDDKLAQYRADELTLKRDDLLRMLEKFLIQFEDALTDGRVRCDNPTDFNTMVRLREFLLGNVDADAGTVGNITLEKIEERYKEMQKMWNDSTPEMRGQVVPMIKKSDKDVLH